MNLKIFATVLLFLSVNQLFGQDSTQIFSLKELYEVVLNNHPTVRQANLLSENARMEIRMARGNFDPKLSGSYLTKDFKDKDYFSMWSGQLKIPTWFGVDFKLGYDQNTGYYLNPENTVPEKGLAIAGISVPLMQGLLIDARRAALREAKLTRELNENERVKIINKLILQAAKDYWQWYFYYQQKLLAQKALELAEFRFKGTKMRALQGELSPIDTVEAKILLQERQTNLLKNSIEADNARLILSNWLWTGEGKPLELSENSIPEAPQAAFSSYTLEELRNFAIDNHPEINKLEVKERQLLIQRKLAREMLKPNIHFNYNFLSPANMDDLGNYWVVGKNYKMGFEFTQSLFVRKERAKLQLTNLKLTQNDLEQSETTRNITTNIETIYNTIQNLDLQQQILNETVENYRRLLAGELQKFDNGESSLFMVNSRESKLIEAEQKVIDWNYKYQKSKAELLWAAGKYE